MPATGRLEWRPASRRKPMWTWWAITILCRSASARIGRASSLPRVPCPGRSRHQNSEGFRKRTGFRLAGRNDAANNPGGYNLVLSGLEVYSVWLNPLTPPAPVLDLTVGSSRFAIVLTVSQPILKTRATQLGFHAFVGLRISEKRCQFAVAVQNMVCSIQPDVWGIRLQHHGRHIIQCAVQIHPFLRQILSPP